MRRIAVALVFSGICTSAACSLFVDTDGLQGGATDGGGGTDASDAASSTDTGTDAGIDAPAPLCDVTTPFDPPVALDDFNSSADDTGLRFSSDELVAYWASDQTGPYQLYSKTRASIDAGFTGSAAPLSINVTEANHFAPSVTSDDTFMVFDSDRDGGLGNRDLYAASRSSPTSDFANVQDLSALNTPGDDARAMISTSGLVLYYASSNSGNYDLFRTERAATSASFPTGTALDALNSTADDSYPVFSQDETVVYFASGRQSGSHYDVFVSTRASANDTFSTPTIVAELQAGADEAPTWLSPDRCRLYFYRASGDGGGPYDLMLATRTPR